MLQRCDPSTRSFDAVGLVAEPARILTQNAKLTARPAAIFYFGRNIDCGPGRLCVYFYTDRKPTHSTVGVYMSRKKPPRPTELELLILKLLWLESPRTARQIRDALAASGRDLAHTSVITTLQKMVD